MSGALRSIVRGESNFNIVARAKRWAVVSGVVLVLSLIGLFGRGLNLSLEFKGGTSLAAPIHGTTTVTVAKVNDAMSKFGLGETKVQVTGSGQEGDKVVVRTKHIEDHGGDTAATILKNVQTTLAGLTGNASINEVTIDDVGPTWGKQVSNKALRALIVFLVLVSLYISFRFEPKMAAGALLALIHDLTATAGIYALIGFEVSPATVIALLTLLGYSLYDTVVVFDKVQENVSSSGSSGKVPYTDLVNQSVNQVMMRSINTSLSTLLPIGALLSVGVFIFGAATLKDLALAMFLGTLVGTYSSIFVASPILALLKEREPRYKAIRARAAGLTTRGPIARATPAAAAAPDEGETATPSVRPGMQAMRVPRQAPKPRKRKRGKRR